jgi:hypothetical protein
MRCKNTRTTVGASFRQKLVAGFLPPHAEKRLRKSMWSRAPKTTINHNTKVVTHHHNWGPAPATPVEATSDWPEISAKASLANPTVFALGNKDNHTFLGTVTRWICGCAGSHRVNPGFNTRGTHFWGLYAFNHPRFSSSPIYYSTSRSINECSWYTLLGSIHTRLETTTISTTTNGTHPFLLPNVLHFSGRHRTKLVTAERA